MDAYLLEAVRTPFGKHRGGLAGIRTDDLAALPLAELLRRYPGLAEEGRVDDVILGDTNGAGEDNRNVARMAALLSGLPPSVPGVTVNRLCASGGINEAFAAMVVSCLHELAEIDRERVNPHGGAIAIGHPLGASAPRVVVDAARELRRQGGGYAVAAACIGVGQGTAMVIKVGGDS